MAKTITMSLPVFQISLKEMYDNWMASCVDVVWDSKDNGPNEQLDIMVEVAKDIMAGNLDKILAHFQDGYTPMLIGEFIQEMENLENTPFELRIYNGLTNGEYTDLFAIIDSSKMNW
jgi:hypothetical protein